MTRKCEPSFAVACNALRNAWTSSGGRLAPVARSLVASCVVLELRLLHSTGITRLPRYYEPLRHPSRPSRTLAGVSLTVTRRHRGGFLCCVGLLSQTCHRHYPGGPTGSCRSVLPRQGQEAQSPVATAFPVSVAGRRPHCAFRGLLDVHSRYGLLVRGIAKQSFPSKAPTASFPSPPLRLLPAGATSCRVEFESTENQHLFFFHSAHTNETLIETNCVM